MTTALITHRYMARVFLGLAFALLLPACGRSLMVTVVDERTGAPIAHAQVSHDREEWRMMGILPRRLPIMQAYGMADDNGQIAFKDVRDGDGIMVDSGGAECTWFTPLWPVTKTKVRANTKAGPSPNAAEQYQRLNADAPPDRLTLPVQRSKPPAP